MKKAKDLWIGSADCSEYTYFENGYDQALIQVEKELLNLLSISKYTEDARLVKTLIQQTLKIVEDAGA